MAPCKAIGVSFKYHWVGDAAYYFDDDAIKADKEQLKRAIAAIIAQYAVLPLSVVEVEIWGWNKDVDVRSFGVYARLMSPTNFTNVVSYLKYAQTEILNGLESAKNVDLWHFMDPLALHPWKTDGVTGYNVHVENYHVTSDAVSVSFPITGPDYTSMTAAHKHILKIVLAGSIAMVLHVPEPAVSVDLTPGRVDAVVLTDHASTKAHYVSLGIGNVTLKMVVERDVKLLVFSPFNPANWRNQAVNAITNVVEPVLWDGVVTHPPDVAIVVDLTQIQGKVLESVSGLGDWLKHHGLLAKKEKAVNFLTNVGAHHVSEAFQTLERGRQFLDALDLLPFKKRRVLADMVGGKISLA